MFQDWYYMGGIRSLLNHAANSQAAGTSMAAQTAGCDKRPTYIDECWPVGWQQQLLWCQTQALVQSRGERLIGWS